MREILAVHPQSFQYLFSLSDVLVSQEERSSPPLPAKPVLKEHPGNEKSKLAIRLIEAERLGEDFIECGLIGEMEVDLELQKESSSGRSRSSRRTMEP
jgi:hypothetical protein